MSLPLGRLGLLILAGIAVVLAFINVVFCFVSCWGPYRLNDAAHKQDRQVDGLPGMSLTLGRLGLLTWLGSQWCLTLLLLCSVLLHLGFLLVIDAAL